jgi:hypothetical protein
MPEPTTIPPAQPPKDDPGFANALDPFWWFYRYRGAIYFGGGGLLLLLTSTETRMKVLGVIFEVVAVLFVLFYIKRHRDRKTPWAPAPAPPPEPYADLQASMARLREEEDREHHR